MTTLNNLTNLENNKNYMEGTGMDMNIINMNAGMKVSVAGEQLVVASDVFDSKRKCAVAMVDIANRHNSMILEGKVNYKMELILDDANTTWLNDRIHDIASYDAEWAVYNILDSMDIVTKGQVVDYVAEGQVVTITIVNPKLAQLRNSFNKQSALFYDEKLMAIAAAKEQKAKARIERKARKLAQIEAEREAERLLEARMSEAEQTLIAISEGKVSMEDALVKLNPVSINNPSKDYSIGGMKRIADRNRKAYKALQGFRYSTLSEENGTVVMSPVNIVVVKEKKVAKKQVKVVYKEGDKGYTAPKGYATPKAPQNRGISVPTIKSTKEVDTVLPVNNHAITSPEFESAYSYNTVVRREESFMFETITNRIYVLGSRLEKLVNEQINLEKEYKAANSFRLNDRLECEYSFLERERLERTSNPISIKFHKDSMKMYEELNTHYNNVVSSYERNIKEIEAIKELISVQRTLLNKVKMSSSIEEVESHLIDKAIPVVVSVPVKTRKAKVSRELNEIANLISMHNYIVKNKVSKDKIARHSIFDNKDARRSSNKNIIRIDSNGEYIKTNNINMPRVDADYNQNTLGSFGMENNSFVAENEALYNSSNRFYSTPVNRADRSASVGTNKLNEVLRMNLQLLASNKNNVEEEIARLNKMKMKQLQPIAESLEIKCISKMRKAELVEAIAKKTGVVECSLTKRYPDNTSQSSIASLVEQFMKGLYTSVALLERFEMINKNGVLTSTCIHQNGRGIRLVEELGKKDYSLKNYIIQNRDDQDNVTSTQVVRVDGTNDNCKINGLILVNIKGAQTCDVQRIEAFITVDENGKRGLTTDASDKRIVSGRYVFAGTNTSGKKHCSFFMKELSEDYTKKNLKMDIDKLTGGAWSYALRKLHALRKSGQKLVTPADLAKTNERVGLDNCSPMLKGTNINSLFIIDQPVDCGPQFNEEQEAFMERNHFEIPRNAMDGCTGGVHYKVVMRMFANHGIKISKAQAMKISMQTRTTTITDKRLAIPQDENMTLASILAYLDIFVTEENDPITLVDYKRGIVLTGKQIKNLLDIENLSSDEKLAKEQMKDFHWIKRVLRNVELVTSTDEAKMINWDAILNVTEPCESPVEMFVLDMSKVSEAKHSNQMLNKTIKYDFENTALYVENETIITLQEAATDTNKTLKLGKDNRIAGQPLDNLYAAKYERAVNDKMAYGNKLSNLDNFVISKVGKANIKCNSYYLKIATFDFSLFEFNQVIGSKEVDYQTETGEIVKVTLNIIYNPVIDRDIKAKCALIDECDEMTDEEKALAKEALRVSIDIKYPAQGTKEYAGSYIATIEELEEIIRSTDKITSSFTKAQAIRKLKKCPHNVLYMFGDTGLLVQCAGSDCDGDAMAAVLNQLSYSNESDIPCVGSMNIMTGKRNLGYVSLGLKKIAEEGSTAAVIGRFNPDNEVQKKQNKRRNARGLYDLEANKATKNIKGVVRSNNLINNETLESSLTVIFDKARKLVEGKECIISSKDFMALPYIPREWDITDDLGVYQATTVFGDNVGITIVLVSVLTMCDTEYFFPGNKFNFEAASDILIPLNNAIKNSKGSRKTERYATVFTEENKRILETKNTSGITRIYIAVLNESINEWAKKVSMLPEDTTMEEWLQLVADFDIIGRNLGETSIDVKKDPTKKNDLDIENLINSKYRCVGNMKPSFLSSNMSNVLYSKENKYEIDCGRFDPKAQDPTILPDRIGAIKLTIKEIAEQFMTIRTKAFSDATRFNLKSYSQYNNIIDQRVNGNTTAILEALLNYIKISNRVVKDEEGNIIPNPVGKMDKEMLRNIEGAIFNMARLEGIPEEDVVALAIQLSFMYEANKTDRKGNFVTSKKFNEKMNYASLLKQTAALFPEVFLAEYVERGNKILEVTLDYDICEGNFFNGDIIEFKDGWNKERTIHVINSYTGKALVKNDTLFALYNAYENVTKNDWVIIPIFKFFDGQTSREFIDSEGTFCIRKRITNAKAIEEAEAKGIKDVKKEFELVLSSADKKTSLAVTCLNNLEGMSGHVYKNASIMGYEIDGDANYFVIAQI